MIPRIEQKLEINKSDYPSVLQWMHKKNAKFLYPERLICSIYFDNFNKDMYYQTVEGITPRKKIRIRTYNSRDFLNTKSNYNLEKKLTTEHSRYKEIKENINPNIYIQDGIFDNLYGICLPQIEISYFREYYEIDNHRITIDKEINYKSINSELIYKEDSFVLEIKANINKDSDYISNLFDFPRTKFSKYERGIDRINNKLNNY